MCNRMRKHDAIVFVNATRLLRLTHTTHIGQTEGPRNLQKHKQNLVSKPNANVTQSTLTSYSHAVVAANIRARYKYRNIMMIWIIFIGRIQFVLPSGVVVNEHFFIA